MRVFVLVLSVWVAGCGPLVPLTGDSESEGSSETGGSETPPPPSSTGTTTVSTSTSTTSPPAMTTDSADGPGETTGDIFLVPVDGGIGEQCMCDLLAQDCPPEEKCVPWANDGTDVWNCSRCSPIAAEPQPLGEPCTVEGWGTSGLDDCGAGLLCWDVDPDTLQGTCVALCTGNPEVPECEGSTECIVANDGALYLCLPPCQPQVVGACPRGQACAPSYDAFVCAPTGEPAGGGSCVPGVLPYGCDPGSVCAPASRVPSCGDEVGCCTPACSLSADPCGELGLVCTSWWGDAPAPPGYEDVGICALP